MSSIRQIVGYFRRALVISLFALVSLVLFFSLWGDLIPMLLMTADAPDLLPQMVVIWFLMGFPFVVTSPPGWIVLLVWFIGYEVSYADLSEVVGC